MAGGDRLADVTAADEVRQAAGARRKVPLLGHDALSQARRQEGAVAARAAGAHLKRDHLDEPLWRELAKERGLRLPQAHRPCTPGQMAVWLRRLGVPVPVYMQWSGERTLKDFGRNNPTWGLRPWLGLLLEALADGMLLAVPTSGDGLGAGPRLGVSGEAIWGERSQLLHVAADPGGGRSDLRGGQGRTAQHQRCVPRTGAPVPRAPAQA